MPELVRDLIGTMVNDVLAETAPPGRSGRDRPRRCARRAGRWPASPRRWRRRSAALKAFLYARMYDAPEVKSVRVEAQAILAGLFAAYRDDPARLPAEWRPAASDPVAVTRAVGDFIAGMTDRYAVRRYEELIGPTGLLERV